MSAVDSAGQRDRIDSRPPPSPDDTTRFFWDAASAGQLAAQRCRDCGKFQYPPDIVCLFCQSDRLEVRQLSGRGTIYSFAVVERAFHPGFVAHLPYVVALIDLSEQDDLRMFANIVDCDPSRLAVGEPVEVVFERRGDVTLPQFRPAGTPA